MNKKGFLAVLFILVCIGVSNAILDKEKELNSLNCSIPTKCPG